MKRATNMVSGTATNSDVRAVVNGRYTGDPHALIDAVANTLLTELSSELHDQLTKSDFRLLTGSTAHSVMVTKLAELLLREMEPDETVSKPAALPVGRLTPAEVIARFGISKSTLYREDHAGMYSVIPLGKKNGRAFPEWQFTGNVLSYLPDLLEILSRKSRFEVHAFFVTEQDALDDLSPAEVLAGLPFEPRGELSPAQAELLALPVTERIDMTRRVALRAVAEPN